MTAFVEDYARLYRELAIEHARLAKDGLNRRTGVAPSAEAHASLASCWASLAVAEELARFEAVAVEERKP